MKILHLSIIVILLSIPVLANNTAKGGCLPSPDWPDAPCYGCPGCIPSIEKQREDWAPYYEYKGAVWMKMMKNQMIEAMRNGTLEDWVIHDPAHYDVWRYYYVNDQAPFFRSSVSGLKPDNHFIPAPLQQLKTGITAKDVTCQQGLQLIIKAEDGSPVCLKPDTAKILMERGWANQVGKDIVLEKPSDAARPFPICNLNPTKEKLIREKQKILVDALLDEEEKYGGFENRTQHLPWSGIGYDCVDNALEVHILPQYFNIDSLPKYFEKIRSIVGNSIDIVLSPEGYAVPV